MVTTFDWSEVAPGWDRHRARADETVSAVTADVLARLALRPGEHVLELASGTGELSRRLANQVGPQGRVLATDAAAGMVELSRATLAGLPQAQVAQVDAAAIPLPDASFDAAAFVMGLMFVVEQEQAAQELRRVLRPGGRAVVTTWAGPQHNLWLAGLGIAAMTHGVVAGGPPVEPGGLFSLTEPEQLERVRRAGGFSDATVEPVQVEMRYADTDTWFDTVSALAGPLAAALAAHPDSVPAVRSTASSFVAQHLTADGLVLPGLALVAYVKA